MTKRYNNPPPPENYTKPKPPPCPPAPPSREYTCNIFGFAESKESIKATEDYMKEKDKGIPYDIVGNGIMTAKAEDIRRYAKHQFDAAGQITNTKPPKQILELAIKICEDYSEDKYKLYKGYPPYKGDEPERAWEYIEGMSDGADKLRELLEELNK